MGIVWGLELRMKGSLSGPLVAGCAAACRGDDEKVHGLTLVQT
jgi:hypothetical protein